jgi:AcrR family transcriptional regulator
MNRPLEADVRLDTKDRILDAAEELFSEQGFTATSLRQITTRAQVNLAAVNYHFHSKIDLLNAVILRRMRPVNARRLEMLAAAWTAAPGGVPAVEELIRAFIQPVLEVNAQRPTKTCVARLVSRIFSEPGGPAEQMLIPALGQSLARFIPLLMAALGCEDRRLVARGFQFGIGGVLIAYLRSGRGGIVFEEDAPEADDPVMNAQLVTFAAGGLRALVAHHAGGGDAGRPGAPAAGTAAAETEAGSKIGTKPGHATGAAAPEVSAIGERDE